MLIGVLRQHEFLLKPCALVCREVHGLRCHIATIELKLATSAMCDITAYGVRSLASGNVLYPEQTVSVRGCIIVRYAIKGYGKSSLGMHHVMMSHKTFHLGVVAEKIRQCSVCTILAIIAWVTLYTLLALRTSQMHGSNRVSTIRVFNHLLIPDIPLVRSGSTIHSLFPATWYGYCSAIGGNRNNCRLSLCTYLIVLGNTCDTLTFFARNTVLREIAYTGLARLREHIIITIAHLVIPEIIKTVSMRRYIILSVVTTRCLRSSCSPFVVVNYLCQVSARRTIFPSTSDCIILYNSRVRITNTNTRPEIRFLFGWLFDGITKPVIRRSARTRSTYSIIY